LVAGCFDEFIVEMDSHVVLGVGELGKIAVINDVSPLRLRPVVRKTNDADDNVP
jgi:hypothetical protein